jgi:hypothetical protein
LNRKAPGKWLALAHMTSANGTANPIPENQVTDFRMKISVFLSFLFQSDVMPEDCANRSGSYADTLIVT